MTQVSGLYLEFVKVLSGAFRVRVPEPLNRMALALLHSPRGTSGRCRRTLVAHAVGLYNA